MNLLLVLCLLAVLNLLLAAWITRAGGPAPAGSGPLRHPEWRFRSRVSHCEAGDGIHGYGDEAVAVINCRARQDQHRLGFRATRRDSCRDLHLQYGGEAECNWACLGAADCVQACGEGAIRMDRGLPAIDGSRCTGCGNCLPACPRSLLSLIPANAQITVGCASDEPAERRATRCDTGCRSSGACLGTAFLPEGQVLARGQRRVVDYTRSSNLVALRGVCPSGVFVDRIAHRPWFTVNEACTGCGLCLPACPVAHCIRSLEIPGQGLRARIDSGRCVGCGLCVPVCPEQAIQVVGALGYDRSA
jgi:electron transport complex protein RnfB